MKMRRPDPTPIEAMLTFAATDQTGRCPRGRPLMDIDAVGTDARGLWFLRVPHICGIWSNLKGTPPGRSMLLPLGLFRPGSMLGGAQQLDGSTIGARAPCRD